MGSPVSPIIADIFMDHFEKHAFETAISSNISIPTVHIRYVDDCLEVFEKNEGKLQSYVGFLNSIHPNITFTYETEENGCLPFLDVLLTRQEEGDIRTSVYRKPTHTNAYVHQRSNQSIRVKKGMIKGQLLRAKRVCKDSASWRTEYEHLEKVFIRNGYSRSMVQRCLREINRKDGRRNEGTKTEHQKPCVSMVYIPGTTEKIRESLRKHGIGVREKMGKKMRHVLVRKCKERSKPLEVVYRIPCKDCPAAYVGETKRGMERRVNEHQRRVRSMDIDHSEIAAHCHLKDHRMEWKESRVLTSEKHWLKRQVKESLWSVREGSFNRRRDVSAAWSSLAMPR